MRHTLGTLAQWMHYHNKCTHCSAHQSANFFPSMHYKSASLFVVLECLLWWDYCARRHYGINEACVQSCHCTCMGYTCFRIDAFDDMPKKTAALNLRLSDAWYERAGHVPCCCGSAENRSHYGVHAPVLVLCVRIIEGKKIIRIFTCCGEVCCLWKRQIKLATRLVSLSLTCSILKPWQKVVWN